MTQGDQDDLNPLGEHISALERSTNRLNDLVGDMLVRLELTEEIQTGLSDTLREQRAQGKRGRRRDKLIAVILALSMLISMAGVYLWWQVKTVTDANESNAVIACRNANDSRAANEQLWTFILEVSVAGDEGQPSPEDVTFRQEFLDYISALFAARDCSDLGRRYELPPPPQVPAP